MQSHAQEGGSKAIFFRCLQLVPNAKLYCTRLLLCEAIEETQMYLFPLTLSRGFMWRGLLSLSAPSVQLESRTPDCCRRFLEQQHVFVLLHFVLCLLFLWKVQCNSLSKRYLALVKPFWVVLLAVIHRAFDALEWHQGQLFAMYATWSLGLCKPGKTPIPTFMSFSAGSKAQASALSAFMPLQCTNKTAISLILIPDNNYLFNQQMAASAKFCCP